MLLIIYIITIKNELKGNIISRWDLISWCAWYIDVLGIEFNFMKYWIGASFEGSQFLNSKLNFRHGLIIGFYNKFQIEYYINLLYIIVCIFIINFCFNVKVLILIKLILAQPCVGENRLLARIMKYFSIISTKYLASTMRCDYLSFFYFFINNLRYKGNISDFLFAVNFMFQFGLLV